MLLILSFILIILSSFMIGVLFVGLTGFCLVVSIWASLWFVAGLLED